MELDELAAKLGQLSPEDLEQVLSNVHGEKKHLAVEEKEKGNHAFKASDFELALVHYTK